VRYWIPNIRIISPEHLQTEVEQQMRDYLENAENNNGAYSAPGIDRPNALIRRIDANAA
jgi:hypothetical protein